MMPSQSKSGSCTTSKTSIHIGNENGKGVNAKVGDQTLR